MKWDEKDIFQFLGGGAITAILTLFANMMGWIRFGRKDNAEVGKLKSETAVDLAVITEKRISDEIKISDQALQWTVNLASRLEQANLMIDKKQDENDRLHSIIDVMKKDFQNVIDDFNRRIKELEREFEKSKQDMMTERDNNLEEIRRLKAQIDGRRTK